MQPIFYFLPMILFLGIITSYEDIKENKIRNKWIIMGIIYALIMNVFLFTNKQTNINYIQVLTLNVMLCLIIGIVLWYFNFWRAGDAKLFFTYTLLIPLNFYQTGFLNYVPSIVIMINIFVIVAVYFLFQIIIKFDKKQFKKAIKIFEWKEILSSALIIFGFFWLSHKIAFFLNINNILLIFLTVFALLWIIDKLFKKYLIWIGLVIVILRIIFDANVFSKNSLLFASIGLIIWLLIKILTGVADDLCLKKVKIEDLREKDVLSSNISKVYKNKKILIENKEAGLTKKEIKMLKILKNHKKINYVITRQNIAFAPILLAGIILTILVKGNILIYLSSMI